MDPPPDYGEASYQGSGRLAGKKTLITGGDSGIGRAVALAFAREGADVLISYSTSTRTPKETQRLVEEAGPQGVLMPGDIKDPAHCRGHRRQGGVRVRPDRRAGQQRRSSDDHSIRSRTSATRSGTSPSAPISTPCSI